MDQLPIDTNTINKTLDIVDEGTKETRKEIDKTTAKGINKLIQLLKSTPLGIKADVYIQERPYKLKKAIEEMKAKYEPIPLEYRVEPSSYIALKGISELNYSLDEEHLKEMFENILVSDMDRRKKSRVLPSYIEIVKQLSVDDVEFLKLLKQSDFFCAIEIQAKVNGNNGIKHLDEYLVYDYGTKDGKENGKIQLVNPIIIDTLSYLNLVENKIGTFYPEREKEYSYLFNFAKKEYQLDDTIYTLTYDKCIIKFTKLGRNFIDICI